MKKFFGYSLILALLCNACSKSSSNKSGNPDTSKIPIGMSAKINGKYTTFRDIDVDTTTPDNIVIRGTTDSLPYQSYRMSMVLTSNNNIQTGLYPNLDIYPGLPNGNESGIAFATTIDYMQVVFSSYDDSVTITSLTDSTTAGTFYGTENAHYINPNNPQTYVDSSFVVTEGQFNLKLSGDLN